jgi:hypothetical protein
MLVSADSLLEPGHVRQIIALPCRYGGGHQAPLRLGMRHGKAKAH